MKITSDFENRYWPGITAISLVVWQWFGSGLAVVWQWFVFPTFCETPKSLVIWKPQWFGSDFAMNEIPKLFGSDFIVVWQWFEWFSLHFHVFLTITSGLAVVPCTLCKSLEQITRGGGGWFRRIMPQNEKNWPAKLEGWLFTSAPVKTHVRIS